MTDRTERQLGNISIEGSEEQINTLLSDHWDGQVAKDDFASGRTLVLRDDVLPTAYGHSRAGNDHVEDEQYAARDLIDMAILDDYVDTDVDVVFDDSETPEHLSDPYSSQKSLLHRDGEQYSFSDDDELVSYAESIDAVVVTTSYAFNDEHGDDVTALPPSAVAAGYKMAAVDDSDYDQLVEAVENGFFDPY